MPTPYPNVLALDFDGVLCDGLREYFQTAWTAYCNLWQISDHTPPPGWAERFYRLRPVVETGWEMPLVLRAIALGISDETILQTWGTLALQLAQKENQDPKHLGAEVDGVRDRWIASDLDSWLAEHRFYPGVIEWLKTVQTSPITVVIISTKETRFIATLLQQQGIDLTHLRIFGKDTRKPKHQILRELKTVDPGAAFWFVEDRLRTLQGIEQQADLPDVILFLADWGYNTPSDRAIAHADPLIHLISLQQLGQDLSTWVNQ
jgi:phosphoglycolate phosphatase-like HAD superfamily hydrolase